MRTTMIQTFVGILSKRVAVIGAMAVLVCAGSVFAHAANNYQVDIQNVTTVRDGFAEYITGVAVNRS